MNQFNHINDIFVYESITLMTILCMNLISERERKTETETERGGAANNILTVGFNIELCALRFLCIDN